MTFRQFGSLLSVLTALLKCFRPQYAYIQDTSIAGNSDTYLTQDDEDFVYVLEHGYVQVVNDANGTPWIQVSVYTPEGIPIYVCEGVEIAASQTFNFLLTPGGGGVTWAVDTAAGTVYAQSLPFPVTLRYREQFKLSVGSGGAADSYKYYFRFRKLYVGGQTQ